MTTALELGPIQTVSPRDIWPDEARDFTPWLSENISLLGNALGMRLKCLTREAAVGSFSLDILAEETASDRKVAIENQLGLTDHSHLGQLLTYGSWYDADVMVWVAGAFRDEHRQALDQLNGRTDDRTEFYGVEVEVFRVNSARIGVNFKLVAIPRQWRNPKQAHGSGSNRSENYKQFYQQLVEQLKSGSPGFTDLSYKDIDTRHFCTLAPAANNVHYSASFGNFAGRNRAPWIQLIIRSGDRNWDENLFSKLSEQRVQIESELGNSLEWRSDHFRKQSGIMIAGEGSIYASSEELLDIREWMVEWLLKFRDVFGPRLAELVD